MRVPGGQEEILPGYSHEDALVLGRFHTLLRAARKHAAVCEEEVPGAHNFRLPHVSCLNTKFKRQTYPAQLL
jgi:hypothetical protein